MIVGTSEGYWRSSRTSKSVIRRGASAGASVLLFLSLFRMRRQAWYNLVEPLRFGPLLHVISLSLQPASLMMAGSLGLPGIFVNNNSTRFFIDSLSLSKAGGVPCVFASNIVFNLIIEDSCLARYGAVPT